MTTLKSMALVLVTALMVLSMDHAFAESEKETTIMTPSTSMQSNSKAVKEDPFKRTIDAIFDRADADKDGKISHDEYMVPYEKKFKENDVNNDGFITKGECEHIWRRLTKTRRMQK